MAAATVAAGAEEGEGGLKEEGRGGGKFTVTIIMITMTIMMLTVIKQ